MGVSLLGDSEIHVWNRGQSRGWTDGRHDASVGFSVPVTGANIVEGQGDLVSVDGGWYYVRPRIIGSLFFNEGSFWENLLDW